MNAFLQSVCDNYSEILSIVRPVNEKYAKKFGAEYVLHVGRQFVSYSVLGAESRRHPAWNKMYSTLELLKSNKYEYVFFLDGDAVFIDDTRDIFRLTKLFPKKHLLICSDGAPVHNNMNKSININTGAFLIKNTPEMIELLNKVIDCEDARLHTERNWEQTAMWNVFNKEYSKYKDLVKVYHENYFNHEVGDWVFHSCLPVHPETLEIFDRSKIDHRVIREEKCDTSGFPFSKYIMRTNTQKAEAIKAALSAAN